MLKLHLLQCFFFVKAHQLPMPSGSLERLTIFHMQVIVRGHCKSLQKLAKTNTSSGSFILNPLPPPWNERNSQYRLQRSTEKRECWFSRAWQKETVHSRVVGNSRPLKKKMKQSQTTQKKKGRVWKEKWLRQDPPLIWVFGHFWLFAPWYRKNREASSVKIFIKKFKGKVGQMCHRSWSLAWGFYTKLYTKTAVSESSMALGRFNLTFLSLGLSLWNLAHLFIMFMATKRCLRFFNFCLGT